MANLDYTDNQALQSLFCTPDGNIVGFEQDDDGFAKIFLQFEVDIKSRRYRANKYDWADNATRFRKFLEKDDDKTVGKVINGLIKQIEFLREKKENDFELDYFMYSNVTDRSITRCKGIAERLLSKKEENENQETAGRKSKKDDSFADEISQEINFDKMPIEEKFKPILKNRLDEAVLCYKNETYLASIVMAGSVLEGALLGYATKHPEKFENVKNIDTLPLANLIDVCEKAGLLSKAAKEFSNVVRVFRNYIHPYGQISDKFEASKEDAEECLFGLKAILRRLK